MEKYCGLTDEFLEFEKMVSTAQIRCTFENETKFDFCQEERSKWRVCPMTKTKCR